MNYAQKFLDNDKFADHVGIKLIEVSEGKATATLELTDKHLNGLGTAHGGVLFTLADLVFAAAANSYGVDAMAININISYFKAVKEGILRAEANEISLSRKLGTYSVIITNEADERIAAFTGTAFRKTS